MARTLLPAHSVITLSAGDPDNTNSAKLLDPRWAKLAPYTTAAGIYKCPADQRRSGPEAGFISACGFSFVDGHAEIHRWLDSRTKPPATYKNYLPVPSGGTPMPNNVDMFWLSEHASAKF